MFDGLTVLEVDDRFDYGETRFLTLGMLNGIVFLVVHTETDETLRLPVRIKHELGVGAGVRAPSSRGRGKPSTGGFV